MKNGSDQMGVSVCISDCDGKIRNGDDNVDVIQLSGTDKNVIGLLCLSGVIATWKLTKMTNGLECSTDLTEGKHELF